MAVRMNDPSSSPSSKDKEHETNQQRRFSFSRRRIRSFSRRSRTASLPDNASKNSGSATSPVVVTTTQRPISSLLRRNSNSNSNSTINSSSSSNNNNIPLSPLPYNIHQKKCVSISPEYYDKSSSCTASITEKEELNSSLTSTSSSEEEFHLSNYHHDNSSRYRDLPQKQQQQQQQQQQKQELSSLQSRSIVQHQPSSQDPMQIWYQSANNLIRSQEMATFASSSKELVCSATGTAFKVAFLPLTLPIHVVTSTTSFVVDTCVHLTTSLVSPPSTSTNNSSQLTTATSSSTPPSLPWFDLLHNASQIVPLVVRTTNQIKDEVGSTVLNLVGLGEENADKEVFNNHDDEISTKENQETTTRKYRYGSYAEGECLVEQQEASSSFLDRLRLDYTEEVVGEEIDTTVNEKENNCHSISAVSLGRSKSTNELAMQTSMVEKSRADVKQNTSQFLLRVDDLGLFLPPQDSIENTNVLLYFIDLSSWSSVRDASTTSDIESDKLLSQTFDLLVSHALSLFSNNPECKLKCNSSNNNKSLTKIKWKPEGSTHSMLKKMQKMKSKNQECNQLLENEILIWSGKFTTCSSKHIQPHHYGYDTPLFMSRGIVPLSPRNFVRLLWDSNRTSEYNKYNVGRSDVAIIQDDSQVLSTTSCNIRGSKIIKSETKVPFTGMSITMSALMHVRPLEDGNGYVIVTRSLSSGKAGCHTDMNSSQVDKNPKSEILWGINVLRTVRESPHQTDLISVSQVGSSIVPGFLSKKIGIMACEDFFSEIRGKQFFN